MGGLFDLVKAILSGSFCEKDEDLFFVSSFVFNTMGPFLWHFSLNRIVSVINFAQGVQRRMK